MKLRKRIFISISYVVLGSLMILLFVGGSILRSFSKKYQPLPHQMVDQNVFTAEDALSRFPGGDDFSRLEEELKAIGYQLYILQDKELIYRGADIPHQESLPGIKSLKWSKEGARIYSYAGVTVVGKEQQGYTLIAQCLREQERMQGVREHQMGAVLVTFLGGGAISIGIIVLLSQVFTYFLAKRIMTPVKALEDGAMRIQQGNLTVPIDYTGKDEFTTVCSVFNQMQIHLAQEQERSAAYEKARTDMVSGISHDLRTPLTSMKGYIKGIQDGVAATPQKQEQYLSIAYRKACDMDVLLQKLFYFSKMETGNLLLDLRYTDLGAFANRFAQSVTEELGQKNASIVVNSTSGVHPVRIDEEQMYRVLLNLMDNAQKYASAKPLVITITIWREDNKEHIDFADNGNGVSDEQLSSIFDQFWRADEARSSQNEKGSGLGLYIVKYIVEAHGGIVSASNGRGLKFHISLPQVKEKDYV